MSLFPVNLEHPDTASHVWTKYGYMLRARLIPSSGTTDSINVRIMWSAYHDKETGELVRRDAHAAKKTGLIIGARFGRI